MTIIRQYNIGGNAPKGGSPFNMISGILMLIVTIFIGYILLKGIFTLLFWLSPILLIAGVALDPKGALQVGKSFINLSKRNPLIPIGILIFCALWFPVIPGILIALLGSFLIGKSFVKKKLKEVFDQGRVGGHTEEKEEFAEYEEVVDEDDFLELPPVQPRAQPRQDSTNEYDNMF